VLHRGLGDLLFAGDRGFSAGGNGGAGEVVEVVGLGLVQGEGAGDGVEDAVGDAAEVESSSRV